MDRFEYCFLIIMKKNLNLLFYVKRTKMKKNGEVPIYLRITVDGIRTETSIGRSISPEKWDPRLQLQKGKSEEARTLNHYLDSLKIKILQDANLLNDRGEDFTAEQIKNRFIGVKEQPKTLVTVFEEHNKLIKLEENLKYSHSTVRQYNTTLSRIKEFLATEFQKTDIPLPDLDPIFIRRFELYLRTKYSADHNTVMKYLKQVKKVIHFSMELGFIGYDPFIGHKTAFKETSRGYLTEEELLRVENKLLRVRRIDQVRDVFIFACYTGLSYSDLKKLTPESVVKGIDGKNWIIYEREKTGIRASIPLLPPAQAIVDKYLDDPECCTEGKLIPVKSNQKLNAYLSEIEEICEIKKRLTMHLARHTFATTVTLTQGVPIETVSKMLGHTSLKTTQIYSKVVDRKIADDMEELNQKLTMKKNAKQRKAE